VIEDVEELGRHGRDRWSSGGAAEERSKPGQLLLGVQQNE
jgi:hypothetical protein